MSSARSCAETAGSRSVITGRSRILRRVARVLEVTVIVVGPDAGWATGAGEHMASVRAGRRHR
jgi:hypothetical protein